MKFWHQCKSCGDAHYFCNLSKNKCYFYGWYVEDILKKYIKEIYYGLSDYCFSCKMDVCAKVNSLQCKYPGIELKLFSNYSSGNIEIFFKCYCKRYLGLLHLHNIDNTYCCIHCAPNYIAHLDNINNKEKQMKFVIKNSEVEQEKPVEISLSECVGGGIEIVANGRAILHLKMSGTIYRYRHHKEIMDKMGIQSNEDGRIKIDGVDE